MFTHCRRSHTADVCTPLTFALCCKTVLSQAAPAVVAAGTKGKSAPRTNAQGKGHGGKGKATATVTAVAAATAVVVADEVYESEEERLLAEAEAAVTKQGTIVRSMKKRQAPKAEIAVEVAALQTLKKARDALKTEPFDAVPFNDLLIRRCVFAGPTCQPKPALSIGSWSRANTQRPSTFNDLLIRQRVCPRCAPRPTRAHQIPFFAAFLLRCLSDFCEWALLEYGMPAFGCIRGLRDMCLTAVPRTSYLVVRVNQYFLTERGVGGFKLHTTLLQSPTSLIL
jgi:hypothetical protein